MVILTIAILVMMKIFKLMTNMVILMMIFFMTTTSMMVIMIMIMKILMMINNLLSNHHLPPLSHLHHYDYNPSMFVSIFISISTSQSHSSYPYVDDDDDNGSAAAADDDDLDDNVDENDVDNENDDDNASDDTNRLHSETFSPPPFLQGSFCPAGSQFPQPCPTGTYGNSTLLRRSEDCTPCPGGYYCEGAGNLEPTDVCDAGFYCSWKAVSSVSSKGLFSLAKVYFQKELNSFL